MLYSNCKLYDFKKKERMRESNNLKDRENGRENDRANVKNVARFVLD